MHKYHREIDVDIAIGETRKVKELALQPNAVLSAIEPGRVQKATGGRVPEGTEEVRARRARRQEHGGPAAFEHAGVSGGEVMPAPGMEQERHRLSGGHPAPDQAPGEGVRPRQLFLRCNSVDAGRQRDDDGTDAAVAIEAIGAPKQRGDRKIASGKRESNRKLAASSPLSIAAADDCRFAACDQDFAFSQFASTYSEGLRR